MNALEGDHKKQLKSGLYLVATPIGNLRDVTLRALDVLRSVDVILCEDTRTSRKLLEAYQIRNKVLPYHDHTRDEVRQKIVADLMQGKAIALISDAGTPMINDPGYKLMQACYEKGVHVTSLPGANAVLTALQLSGLPSDAFSFLGFFPNKTKARQDLLRDWMNTSATLIAFETAPRLIDALADIGKIMGEREVAIVREMTKMFEEVRRGSVSNVLAHYQEHGPPKGEIVIVIGPPQKQEVSEADLKKELKAALKTMKTKEASAFVAEKTSVSKTVVYDLAIKMMKK